MNTIHTDPTTNELLAKLASVLRDKKIQAAEPENSGALPEDQGVMPENKPEKNLKIQVYDEGNCVYDEGESGPFGWKPRSPLDRLAPPLQEYVLDLLENRTYENVKCILSRPKPLGLGLKTSIGVLHAFYYRHRADDLDEKREMLQEQTDYILAQAGDNDEKFIKAAKHLFKRRLLESSIAPTSSTAELRALFGILNNLTSAELNERRVRLAEQRAQQKQNQHGHAPDER
jgi:hypothetical protein